MVGDGEEDVQFYNKAGEEVNLNYYTDGHNTVDIGQAEKVPVGSKIKIVIEITRLTRTEAFIISNNFRVGLATTN